MNFKITSLIVVFSVVQNAAAQFLSIGDLQRRADQYSNLFFDGELPNKYLDVKVANGIAKTRELKTVIPGVLYRAGGPSGQRPLPQEALNALCEAGFSVAIYGYTENFRQAAPTKCISRLSGQPNSLSYIAVEANTDAAKKTAIRAVYAALQDSRLGPVLVHCWNGYHASGELAAISLRQVCPRIWSGDKASQYWLRLANGAPLISRVKKFSPLAEFEVPSSLESTLCPQTN